MAYKRGNSTNKLTIRGNRKEQELFTEVSSHYDMARDDLDARIPDFDKKDELFRTYIDESSWPYNSLVFDPRVFTFITEKTSRLLANKPRGRMVPREGGDTLGARINNELLNYQWDENEKVDNMPMIAKWAMMDQNARKYGAAFALAKWKYVKKPRKYVKKPKRDGKDKKGKDKYKSVCFYDGPDFKPLVNRDCLPNPSYSSIKNWFQHREYVTLQELENTNDAARAKPIYKNLDLLRQAIKEAEETKSGGDKREDNWASKNKAIKDLSDFLGQDEYFKTIEIITEYRENRWITFAPKHGVVIRDIPNPYDHGQIPVVMLRYYIVDDDLYGLSEIEPIERLQKATNALMCQYLDTVNMSLYTPLKIRANSVQMHTLEFGPGKKWIMNDPSSDVITHDMSPTGVTEFTSTYRFLISAMQEALGETSAALSNIIPGKEGKTATEVKDSAMQRNARDNYNQIFLSEALKKQMMFWHLMNRQFLFNEADGKQKAIRIIGKDAIRYFQMMEMDKHTISDETGELLSDPEIVDVMNQMGEDVRDYVSPVYPVETKDEGTVPKFSMDEMGESGKLYIEPEDMAGLYDYIPDIESMTLPDDSQITANKERMLGMVLNPTVAQQLAQEGYKVKVKELMEDLFEDLGSKDADKYFEKLQGGLNGQIGQAGGAIPPTGPMAQGAMPEQGMAGSPEAVAGGQAGPVVPGPQQF